MREENHSSTLTSSSLELVVSSGDDSTEQEPAMTMTQRPSERITEEVTSWPGVVAGPGRRGEFAFRLGRREIGHLHGDHAAHFSFPKEVGIALREEGRVVDHPVFPGKPGPAARAIEHEGDVRDVIALLRLNYDRAVARNGLPARGEDR
jgi:Luciferase